MKKEIDLGRDKIAGLVLRVAIPSMLAQFVNVLYSIVDRMFVGNIPDYGTLSLAGVGVCGPIVTMISAFAFLIGIGGAPLLGIALGEEDEFRATRILANCFLLLTGIAILVTIGAFAFKEPMLRLFGASDVTYPYADAYFSVYVSGTIFALLSIGMYQFAVAQGYAKVGMFSVILGAVMNIILDPVFIYFFDMGVKGAAFATVLSQMTSSIFILNFLFKKSRIRITFGDYQLKVFLQVLKMGFTPFIIIAMDNLMIIAMNALLQKYGGAQGDVLIMVNTIMQSFMLVVTMPLGGISGGTQCILSFNYGAGNSKRVTTAQKYIVLLCMAYTTVLFILARVAGGVFVSLFTSDPAITEQTLQAIRICTMMIIPLGAQYAIVDGFTGMGQVQLALPLSFWRKGVYFAAVFLIPLWMEADKIFYAEPISDIISILVSLPVFMICTKKILKKRELYLARQKAKKAEALPAEDPVPEN